MSEHYHAQTIPRGALVGAGVLIVFTLAVAAGSRRAHLAEAATVAPAAESAQVRFEDRPDGSLAVMDPTTGREIVSLAPGSNNFVRGVLRGMFRGRKLESIGHDGVFVLSRDADGKLTIEDPQTNRRVELDSFGPTNYAAFSDILTAARRAR